MVSVTRVPNNVLSSSLIAYRCLQLPAVKEDGSRWFSVLCWWLCNAFFFFYQLLRSSHFTLWGRVLKRSLFQSGGRSVTQTICLRTGRKSKCCCDEIRFFFKKQLCCLWFKKRNCFFFYYIWNGTLPFQIISIYEDGGRPELCFVECKMCIQQVICQVPKHQLEDFATSWVESVCKAVPPVWTGVQSYVETSGSVASQFRTWDWRCGLILSEDAIALQYCCSCY